LGPGGRRFESAHPDQQLSEDAGAPIGDERH